MRSRERIRCSGESYSSVTLRLMTTLRLMQLLRTPSPSSMLCHTKKPKTYPFLLRPIYRQRPSLLAELERRAKWKLRAILETRYLHSHSPTDLPTLPCQL